MATFTPSHSFIVRIWLDEGTTHLGRVRWHGKITHVVPLGEGEHRYVHNLDDIAGFISPYLTGMGVWVGVRWQVRQWLNR